MSALRRIPLGRDRRDAQESQVDNGRDERALGVNARGERSREKGRGEMKGNRALKLLQDAGAKLIRSKKHLVFELPNGQITVASKTPRNERFADRHVARELRQKLGVADERGKPGERREKSRTPGRVESVRIKKSQGKAGSTMAEQLQQTGVVSLRNKINQLETEATWMADEITRLTDRNLELADALRDAESRKPTLEQAREVMRANGYVFCPAWIDLLGYGCLFFCLGLIGIKIVPVFAEWFCVVLGALFVLLAVCGVLERRARRKLAALEVKNANQDS